MPLRCNKLVPKLLRSFLILGLIGFLPALPVQGAMILPGCFPAPENYQVNYSYELVAADNYIGKTLMSTHLIGNGPMQTANCNCPPAMKKNASIYEMVYASSPLFQGHSTDYGKLTDAVDVQITGFTDAANSPTGINLFELQILQYPTPASSMPSKFDGIKTVENTEAVCSPTTDPNRPPPSNKRQFKLNIINARLYLKHSILGEEIIPPTNVVQYYVCLSDSPSDCTAGQAELASNVWFGGTITAPLSCTINAGSTIEVSLGMMSSTSFSTRGQPPQGYTLREADISYHCDNPAISNAGKIKMTLTADQGVSDSGTALIAKMIGRDDIGVRMYDSNNNDVILDGSIDLPITLDNQGNGTVKMWAAPVSTGDTHPEPGKFEGNVTVKMDIK